MDSKDIGNVSELAIMLEFTKKGIPVFIPYGDSCSFDLVVHISNKFYRVEVKTGRSSKNGCIMFGPYMTTYDKGRNRKDVNYVGKADLFGVYYPQNQKSYLVYINEDLPKRLVSLRVDFPKNRHKRHIRWASDYEFDIQLKKLVGGMV